MASALPMDMHGFGRKSVAVLFFKFSGGCHFEHLQSCLSNSVRNFVLKFRMTIRKLLRFPSVMAQATSVRLRAESPRHNSVEQPRSSRSGKVHRCTCPSQLGRGVWVATAFFLHPATGPVARGGQNNYYPS
eukprot:1965257-Pleurochrysis_carterae.AAC.1